MKKREEDHPKCYSKSQIYCGFASFSKNRFPTKKADTLPSMYLYLYLKIPLNRKEENGKCKNAYLAVDWVLFW